MYNADIFLTSKTKHLNRSNDTNQSGQDSIVEYSEPILCCCKLKVYVTITVKLFSALVYGEKAKKSFSRHLILSLCALPKTDSDSGRICVTTTFRCQSQLHRCRSIRPQAAPEIITIFFWHCLPVKVQHKAGAWIGRTIPLIIAWQ